MNLMHSTADFFCFTIENRRFAIPVSVVDTVIMAVTVLPVPNAPQVIYGVFDFHGVVLPVINLRQRLNLPDQPVRISDVFIVADTKKRKLALVADRAVGIITPTAMELIHATDIDQGFESDTILHLEDGMVLIYDIEKFLSAHDEIELNQALEKHNEDKTKPDSV